MKRSNLDHIHPALQSLVVDINLLDELAGNPRIGDVEAIAASLLQFGQVKPIVVHPTDDGRYTILAGNHTTKAARLLGWEQVACVVGEDMSDSEAAAFALVDNRVAELGYSDDDLINAAVMEVADLYPELFEVIGWDEYEISSMEVAGARDEVDDTNSTRGYTPFNLVDDDSSHLAAMLPTVVPVTVVDATSDSGTRLVAPAGTDDRATVIAGVGGATSQSPNAKKAQMQYSLVFDDVEEMTRWWDFVRFLRSSPVYEGDTVTTRLMQFAEAHGEF